MTPFLYFHTFCRGLELLVSRIRSACCEFLLSLVGVCRVSERRALSPSWLSSFSESPGTGLCLSGGHSSCLPLICWISSSLTQPPPPPPPHCVLQSLVYRTQGHRGPAASGICSPRACPKGIGNGRSPAVGKERSGGRMLTGGAESSQNGPAPLSWTLSTTSPESTWESTTSPPA